MNSATSSKLQTPGFFSRLKAPSTTQKDQGIQKTDFALNSASQSTASQATGKSAAMKSHIQPRGEVKREIISCGSSSANSVQRQSLPAQQSESQRQESEGPSNLAQKHSALVGGAGAEQAVKRSQQPELKYQSKIGAGLRVSNIGKIATAAKTQNDIIASQKDVVDSKKNAQKQTQGRESLLRKIQPAQQQSLDSSRNQHQKQSQTLSSRDIQSQQSQRPSKIGSGVSSKQQTSDYSNTPSNQTNSNKKRQQSLIGSEKRCVTQLQLDDGEESDLFVFANKEVEQDQSPFTLADEIRMKQDSTLQNKAEEVQQLVQDTSKPSFMQRFGFKGRQSNLEQRPNTTLQQNQAKGRLNGQTHQGQRNSIGPQTHGPQEKPFQPSDVPQRTQSTQLATVLENARLQETIKSLESNLALLPKSFNRISRLRERSEAPQKTESLCAPQRTDAILQFNQQIKPVIKSRITQSFQEPIEQIPLSTQTSQVRDEISKERISLRGGGLKAREVITRDANLIEQTKHKVDDLIQSLQGIKFATGSISLKNTDEEVMKNGVEQTNLPLTAYLPKAKEGLTPSHQLFLKPQTNFKEASLSSRVVVTDQASTHLRHESVGMALPPIGDDDDQQAANEDDDMIFEDDDLLNERDEDFKDGMIEKPQDFIASPSSHMIEETKEDRPSDSQEWQEEFMEKQDGENPFSLAQSPAKIEKTQRIKEETKFQERISLTAIHKKQAATSSAQVMKKQFRKESNQEDVSPMHKEATPKAPITKYGLSACQKQGPAKIAKRAFENRRMHRAQQKSFDQDPRQECELCFRRFNLDSFERHILICEKVFFKKRKAFDSLKQRTLGDEHYQMIEAAMQKFSYYNENVKLNTKWKIRSAQFRMAVQQAKNPGQMPIEQSNGDNRVQCPYCLKRFANETAERHVPLCERKTRDLKNKGGVKPNGKQGVKAMSSTQKGGACFNKKL